jgi:hypothetical protein
MNISKKFLLLFSILLILPSLFSLTVSIQPKYGDSPATACQYEIVDYVINVKNDLESEITDVALKVSVDPALKIVEGYEELDFKLFKLPVMGPKELREEEVKIKPILDAKTAEGKKLLITVDYGISTLSDYSGTHMLVVDSPLTIDSKLSAEKINVGEDASVILDVSNASDSDISSVSFELLGNEDFYFFGNSSFNVSLLKPNESVEEKLLEFKSTKAAEKQNLILKWQFNDSIGTHILQKNFSVKEQPKTMAFIYGLIILVLALILFTLFKIVKGKKSGNSHQAQEYAASHKAHVAHGEHAHEEPSNEPESEEDLEEESEEEPDH